MAQSPRAAAPDPQLAEAASALMRWRDTRPLGGRIPTAAQPPAFLDLTLDLAPADFRCGIDGLAQRVRRLLADEPMSGAVFVFRNRRGSAIKLLADDGQGFWLCHTRLLALRLSHR